MYTTCRRQNMSLVDICKLVDFEVVSTTCKSPSYLNCDELIDRGVQLLTASYLSLCNQCTHTLETNERNNSDGDDWFRNMD